MKRVAIMSEDKIEYLFISRPDLFSGVGNIYKGRIEKIIHGLNAAFINIGGPRNGFLPFEKEECLYAEGEVDSNVKEPAPRKHSVGDEIIVQISKPMTEEKGMKLTTQISIPGRFIVVLPQSSLRTISKKITDKAERERLMTIVSKKITDNTGFIIRTAAEGQNEKFLLREVKILLNSWSKIKRYAKVKKAPSILWEDLPIYAKIIRDFTTRDYHEILVDDPRIYKEVRRYVSIFVPELHGKVKFHNENAPLFIKYGIEKKIENALSHKVFLPSGGYLLVEEGETLNAIDVNTGSSDKNSYRATIFNTNIEAAREIPRQIRLRNLSGLIIIDFIDMRQERQRRKVFNEFNANLEIDKAQINILAISRLGLVEMSREKTEFRLSEIFLDKCPNCKGSGAVKNTYLDALTLKNGIALLLMKSPQRKINVEVSRHMYGFINETHYLENLVRNRKILIKENLLLEEGQYKIY
ncbi:MAG TPA: Rne/Rng family ribonuclease [bacterium]|nr:Rne/Rng family ribonuclease [bacterium]